MAHCAAGALTSYPDYDRLLPLPERIETRWCLGGVTTLHLCSTLVLWQGDYDKGFFYRAKDGHAMREYLLRRLLLLIPTLLGVTFIVFLMMHFIPGDPVTNMMGETYSAEDAQKLRHELGLDQPMLVQYGKWLVLLLRGDWDVPS